MENNGKVSIIMGIYNCEDTLSAAIDSIISQTYANWELIMCDDASTDNTYQVAEQFANHHSDKIKLLRNNSNMRLSYSLNRCLSIATGYYVARMDGDDISKEDRLEKQVLYLQNHPEIDLVGTAMQRFNENGLGMCLLQPEKPDKYSMINGSPFNHATILTYKRVYDKLQGYTVSERTNRAQDYDLWFRFFHEGFKGANIQEPLYLVREDRNAVRRRTFKVRWNAFKTTRYGFKLLGFPKHWILKPATKMIVKSITPHWAFDVYRNYQRNSSNKK